MNANLPSEDEEDDDYDPSADPTGEKDPSKQQKSASRKRYLNCTTLLSFCRSKTN
jgi:hypothetical protein